MNRLSSVSKKSGAVQKIHKTSPWPAAARNFTKKSNSTARFDSIIYQLYIMIGV